MVLDIHLRLMVEISPPGWRPVVRWNGMRLMFCHLTSTPRVPETPIVRLQTTARRLEGRIRHRRYELTTTRQDDPTDQGGMALIRSFTAWTAVRRCTTTTLTTILCPSTLFRPRQRRKANLNMFCSLTRRLSAHSTWPRTSRSSRVVRLQHGQSGKEPLQTPHTASYTG